MDESASLDYIHRQMTGVNSASVYGDRLVWIAGSSHTLLYYHLLLSIFFLSTSIFVIFTICCALRLLLLLLLLPVGCWLYADAVAVAVAALA